MGQAVAVEPLHSSPCPGHRRLHLAGRSHSPPCRHRLPNRCSPPSRSRSASRHRLRLPRKCDRVAVGRGRDEGGLGSKVHGRRPSCTRMLWQANRTESRHNTPRVGCISWAMGAGVNGKSACQMPLSPTRNTTSRWKTSTRRAPSAIPSQGGPAAGVPPVGAPVVDTTVPAPHCPHPEGKPLSPAVGSCPGWSRRCPRRSVECRRHRPGWPRLRRRSRDSEQSHALPVGDP